MFVSGWTETRPLGPLSQAPSPRTHVKGLTKGIMATKDRVGDRDQGWARPFLPWGEVISSIIFCLGREVSSERPQASSVGPDPTNPISLQPSLPGRQRSQSLRTCFGHEGTGLRPRGQGALQQLPQPLRLLPQVGPPGLPLPAANEESIRDLARAVSSPLAHPWPTHRLWGCQEGAGQSVDDAVEGHDVPHNDVANHNCSWDL